MSRSEIKKSNVSEPFPRLSKRSRPTCTDVNLLVRLFRSEIKKSNVSEPFPRLSKRSRPTENDSLFSDRSFAVGNKTLAGAVFFVDVVDVLVATAGKAYED